jgi:pyrroloquinoline quinone biosynthesis protein B
MKKILITLLFAYCHSGCTSVLEKVESEKSTSETFIQVLGVAQDAGYPQAGCQKTCCQKQYAGHISAKMTSCIAIVDRVSKTYWMVDATPDFKKQLQVLQFDFPDFSFGGIFLTHAHVGHYTGLIHLGREIIGASEVPVYAMPRMADFLKTNGPWSQLVNLKNIDIVPIQSDSTIYLNDRLSIIPIKVPHRDEYSETVGYKIIGEEGSLLFIPDIDKWDKWDRSIVTEIQNVDHALLDGSFYQNGEIPGRDMALIPHPFIEESLQLFKAMGDYDRGKVQFIHFNHTNPVMDPRSSAYQTVINNAIGISEEGDQLGL